jgi:hypothetical protein
VPISFKSPEAFVRTVGVSGNTVATFKQIAGWVAAASTVVGAIGVVVDVIKFLTAGPDPVHESLQRIENELAKMQGQQHAGILSQRIFEAGQVRGGAFESAIVGLRSFQQMPSEAHRKKLVDELEKVHSALLVWSRWETNQLPFYSGSYQMLSGEAAPPWMTGNWVIVSGEPVVGAIPDTFGASLPVNEFILPGESGYVDIETVRPTRTSTIQAMHERGNPSHNWLLPKSLTQGELRWDGRIGLPLLLEGAALYVQTLGVAEPYYRTTGHERHQIEAVITGLTRFADDWDRQLLVTADMPVPAWACEDPDPIFGMGGKCYPKFTFSLWPCGAADPVFGTSWLDSTWWQASELAGFGGGLMGQDQQAEHAKARSKALDGVRRENGLSTLRTTIDHLRQLLLPPWESESLKVHAQQETTKRVLTSTPATAETFDVLVEPTVFEGVHEAREVEVRVPIAVQANPGLANVPNLPRTAQSDVTFGYKIDLIGEDDTRFTVFECPLRRRDGQAGLWHTNRPGLDGLQPIPRDTQSHLVTLKAFTYLQYADTHGRLDRWEELGAGTVKVHCRVRVSNLDHDPIPGITDTWPPHGVIWLELRSDDPTNPSFSLQFEVTETTNIREDGTPGIDVKDLVTYTWRSSAFVNARVGVFAPAYFEQYEQEEAVFREKMHEVSKRFVKAKPFKRPGAMPEELIDPLGPFTKLLDDPRWAPSAMSEIQRVLGRPADVEVEAIRRGVAQVRDKQKLFTAVRGFNAGERTVTVSSQPLSPHARGQAGTW